MATMPTVRMPNRGTREPTVVTVEHDPMDLRTVLLVRCWPDFWWKFAIDERAYMRRMVDGKSQLEVAMRILKDAVDLQVDVLYRVAMPRDQTKAVLDIFIRAIIEQFIIEGPAELLPIPMQYEATLKFDNETRVVRGEMSIGGGAGVSPVEKLAKPKRAEPSYERDIADRFKDLLK